MAGRFILRNINKNYRSTFFLPVHGQKNQQLKRGYLLAGFRY
jgi:hypothetical protein